MLDTWLPTGQHWGLSISHLVSGSPGPFVPSDPKLIWHTTEGAGFDGALTTLVHNDDQPHFLIDMHTGRTVQFIPTDRSSKSLQHPPETPETNRAGCIQVEIVGFADHSGEWSTKQYFKLAALAVLIEHRVKIARHCYHDFGGEGYRRLSPNGFAHAEGHLGHRHVPNNDHIDPGPNFKIKTLISLMSNAEKQFGEK